MTAPTPRHVGPHLTRKERRELAESSQVRYPWRATLRTVAAVIGGLLPAVPAIVEAVRTAQPLLAAGGLVALAAGAGLVTQIMAIPAVDAALRRVGLGSIPKETPTEPSSSAGVEGVVPNG